MQEYETIYLKIIYNQKEGLLVKKLDLYSFLTPNCNYLILYTDNFLFW